MRKKKYIVTRENLSLFQLYLSASFLYFRFLLFALFGGLVFGRFSGCFLADFGVNFGHIFRYACAFRGECCLLRFCSNCFRTYVIFEPLRCLNAFVFLSKNAISEKPRLQTNFWNKKKHVFGNGILDHF